MVTLSDVAKKAGVSSATVSRVVRGQGKVGDACRAKVQAVIKEMGYRPNSNARALASKKSDMIGIITPRLSIPFHGAIASGVYQIAREINYKVLMSNSFNETETEFEAIESFRQQGCENIIIHSKYTPDETLRKWAAEIPGLVIINRYVEGLSRRCIWLENKLGGRMAIEHLIQQGHRDFVVISSDQNIDDPKERLLGVKAALTEVGLELTEDRICFISPSIDNGGQAIKQLQAKNLSFTAVIAFNDSLAIGAMNALQDAGVKVPEQVSVIGFDDADICQACRPKLTTMHYPVSNMAIAATKLSLALLDETTESAFINETIEQLYFPMLVERQSVAKR